MKTSTIIWIIVLVIVIVIGIWYWSSTGSGNYTESTSTVNGTPAATSTTNTTVVLDTATTSTLGTYLVAANGMTLYQFTKDKPGASNCTGQCAVTWPPYTVPTGADPSTLSGGAGATGQIGVITRADGTSQLTYNNIPVYFYSKDQSIGDINGQGVQGTWFVVAPSDAASASVNVSSSVSTPTPAPTTPAPAPAYPSY